MDIGSTNPHEIPLAIHLAIRMAPSHIDLLIKLTPNASDEKIIGVVNTADDEQRLAIKVRAVPEKGKANKAVLKLMAKQLSLPKSTLEVASGTTNRHKTIRITGDPKVIVERLQQLEF